MLRVKIMVVCRHKVVRDGVALVLGNTELMEVVGRKGAMLWKKLTNCT